MGNIVSKVCVVMATYNGECYLSEQIDSILCQLDDTCMLYVSDDGSTDGTLDILLKYEGVDSRVVISSNVSNKGCARNFMDSLFAQNEADFDYFALSDQDDIWMPGKLSRAIDFLDTESNNEPALYYSNIANYREGMDSLASFACVPKLSRQIQNDFLAAFFYPRALGCTYVFNSKMLSVLRMHNPSSFPRLHDGWIVAVAMLTGTVFRDFEYSGIRRRIAGQNLTTPKEGLKGKIAEWQNGADAPFSVLATELLLGYSEFCSCETCAMLSSLADAPKSLNSKLGLLRHGLPKVGLFRQMCYVVKVIGGRL